MLNLPATDPATGAYVVPGFIDDLHPATKRARAAFTAASDVLPTLYDDQAAASARFAELTMVDPRGDRVRHPDAAPADFDAAIVEVARTKAAESRAARAYDIAQTDFLDTAHTAADDPDVIEAAFTRRAEVEDAALAAWETARRLLAERDALDALCGVTITGAGAYIPQAGELWRPLRRSVGGAAELQAVGELFARARVAS